MNIEELKQVGEMLNSLKGAAYDGYLLWVGREYLDLLLSFCLWCLFWVGAYRFGRFAITKVNTEMEASAREKKQIREFEKIGEMIVARVNFYTYPASKPESVTREVEKLIAAAKGDDK